MEAIVNNLIKATGWSIFHSLWQGAIIYGVFLFLITIFPKLNAKVKHNMAYSAICFMFIGFCITFFSIFKLPAGTIQQVGTAMVIPAGYADNLASLSQQINSKTENIFPYLVGVYTVGILIQLFVLAVGYKKLLLLKQANRSAVPATWLRVFETIHIKLNLHQHIGFFLSDKVNVPLVIGYVKPIVLFPVALVAQLDILQIEAILIHELSHIRRNDYLLNLIKTGIETLLFFNPFIWLSSRSINIEREHACDDLVLKFTGTPVTYAHALLKLEILKDKHTPALSMAATGNNQYLYQRIKRITNMKTNYINAKQQIFAITLTVATVISLAWVSPAKTTVSENNKMLQKQKIDKSLAVKSKLPLEVKAKPSSQKITSVTDTTRKKRKFKIVTIDAGGNRKEYDSVKEMPDSLRQEVIKETFSNNIVINGLDSNLKLAKTVSDIFKNTAKLRLQTGKATGYMDTSELQKKIEEARKKAAISKRFESEDLKAEQEDLFNGAIELQKRFNSPEWKKQQEDIHKQTTDALKQRIIFKGLSLESKQQMEEMKKLKNSPEYKELKRKFDKDLQKIKKKKGIKSDVGLLSSPDDYFSLEFMPKVKLENIF